MIIDYGFSLIGKSHIAKGVCCQDNHKIKRLDNGWYIAAIADGVGSAKNSHIGSKIATETVVAFCEEYMPWDYNIISIKSMMRTAYNYAFKQILRESKMSGETIESYDTTLDLVIYDGSRIIYGHSGDGGIVGLNTFGDYIPITKPQKGADGITVIPLRAGYSTWKIDTYEEELAAVLLMTDGMWDNVFFPYLLRDNDNGLDRVYVPAASFFGDPICFSGDIEEAKQTVREFLLGDEKFDVEKYYAFIDKVYEKRVGRSSDKVLAELKKNNYPIVLMQAVQDDKTMVGLINTDSVVDDREESFYQEPDWLKLQDAWNRKAYPHLYVQDTVPTVEEKMDNPIGNHHASDITESGPNDNKMKDNKSEVDQHDSVVPLIRRPESDRTRQVLAPYGGKSELEVPKTDLQPMDQSIAHQKKIKKKDTSMEKHGKPKKKSIIGRIEDAFD